MTGDSGPALERRLESLIRSSAFHIEALSAVRALDLPCGCIGAGFVRNLVWDMLHAFDAPTPLDDIDVICFDPGDLSEDTEKIHEARLAERMPGVPWSVKNQARMHLRNNDAPYEGIEHALRHWLEVPTAVAVRLNDADELEIVSPFGLRDLFGLTIRPTPHARRAKPDSYTKRVTAKPWRDQWPQLTVVWPEDVAA